MKLTEYTKDNKIISTGVIQIEIVDVDAGNGHYEKRVMCYLSKDGKKDVKGERFTYGNPLYGVMTGFFPRIEKRHLETFERKLAKESEKTGIQFMLDDYLNQKINGKLYACFYKMSIRRSHLV